MAYADFTYYTSEFKGTLIKDEATFRTFAERSSEYIDMVTFDRLSNSETLSRYITKVQKCVCLIAEMYFRRNYVTADGIPENNDMPKNSETIGSYSVTFANQSDFIQEMKQSESDFRKSLKNTALQYLGNTELMFRGID